MNKYCYSTQIQRRRKDRAGLQPTTAAACHARKEIGSMHRAEYESPLVMSACHVARLHEDPRSLRQAATK